MLRRLHFSRKRSKEPEDFVFFTRSLKHYSHTGVYKSFKTVVGHIGCPSARFHDLRHTYAVMSLEAGIDPKTILRVDS
ncbi:MAG: tyrosine-type recombinase/integrase [Oscillospiraceae bacterium]|nr:tyrosine-type recombinase/integrase [Oscillospiraceae bacterium]